MSNSKQMQQGRVDVAASDNNYGGHGGHGPWRQRCPRSSCPTTACSAAYRARQHPRRAPSYPIARQRCCCMWYRGGRRHTSPSAVESFHAELTEQLKRRLHWASPPTHDELTFAAANGRSLHFIVQHINKIRAAASTFLRPTIGIPPLIISEAAGFDSPVGRADYLIKIL